MMIGVDHRTAVIIANGGQGAIVAELLRLSHELQEAHSRIDNLTNILEGNEILIAIKDLLLSEDNEGCTDDLTVVSREAIEKLRAAYERERLKR